MGGVLSFQTIWYEYQVMVFSVENLVYIQDGLFTNNNVATICQRVGKVTKLNIVDRFKSCISSYFQANIGCQEIVNVWISLGLETINLFSLLDHCKPYSIMKALWKNPFFCVKSCKRLKFNFSTVLITRYCKFQIRIIFMVLTVGWIYKMLSF